MSNIMHVDFTQRRRATADYALAMAGQPWPNGGGPLFGNEIQMRDLEKLTQTGRTMASALERDADALRRQSSHLGESAARLRAARAHLDEAIGRFDPDSLIAQARQLAGLAAGRSA